ncbi:ATP-binding protein [Actinoplanes teichomyceticus]|uniref:histidine kinase n=1 Tax=Actinoplanes teichomyceticus TaxID=1867 RepID=A0A561VCK9_ACTTI|nr:ATP-binding protein [Actinoplanes teichomyceticus]TWG09327.1 PAS domain S-box-containing protein [Actinoplanes teichomyceticus]GIF16649.1 hypothetical protein Ate01nite_66810 [Actinoplanes teichomyceticus]
MIVVDDALLRDPVRLAAVDTARRALALLPVALNAVAALAARLTEAPMGMVTLIGDEEEYFVGVHHPPPALNEQGHAPMAYSVCKYVVSAGRPVDSGDMFREPGLREHLLATQYGVRAFLGVPLRDGAGQPVGSLTVLDTEARQWSDEQAALLAEIAGLLRPGALPGPVPAGGMDSASLLDSTQEAFLAVDRDGVVVSWNRAAEEMLGYTADEVCGRHLDESVLPDYDGRPIGVALTRLFSTSPRREVSRRVSVRHRNGRRLTAQASLSVVGSADGPRACVFLTDLTGQAAAEEAADRNGSFLAALLESLTVGVIACDNEGRLVVVNRVLREAQGLPPVGEVPIDWPRMVTGSLLHPDGTPISWERTPLMRALHGETVPATDVVVERPGHRPRTFSTIAQPITGSGGRMLGAVAVGREITALRRVERFRTCHLAVAEAIAAANEPPAAAPGVLRAVAITLGWPYAELWVIDQTGEHLDSVGRWSAPGSEELADYIPVKGVGVTGRVWATGQPLWVANLADADWLYAPDSRARTELSVRLGIRTVLSVPVRNGNTMLGVLSCYSTVVEPHQDVLTVLLDGVAAQFGVFVAMCRATELSRQLERARDDFLALIGHEMRTPLTSIAANATLLGEEAAGLDEDSRQMVRSIERNTAALRGIVETLLDLAGLEAGHIGLTVRDVDLAALVTDAANAAGPTAAGNGVRLSTDLPERLGMTGDPARLREVVDDLLSNAIKYSRDGGDVRVHLRSHGTTAELRVTDTGIGVPGDEIDQLFARFYRASNVRHQGVPGSGLGLTRARTIVEMHGGAITITGHEPTGTTAVVRLPLRNEQA